MKELCHAAKKLSNEAINQCASILFYRGRIPEILKEVDGSFKSFFGLLKLVKQGKYAFKDCKLPHYLPKDGYTTLVIGFVRLKGKRNTYYTKSESKVL